ncbi:MAG: hypothetical protein EA392_09870 [Cryomorphaceae bacterium]|nr:MAG: hypothetical protein EA392_09870 [Cryomorphaceae bacterium]
MCSNCFGQQAIEQMFDWSVLIDSDRFRSNAVVKRDGETIDWVQFTNKGDYQEAQYTFSTDSVHWQFQLENERYLVSFPNDVSLLTNRDKGELTSELYAKLANIQSSAPIAYPDSILTERSFLHAEGERDEILQQQVFLKTSDSSLVCHPAAPIASILSSLVDTSYCPGVILKLITYNYGYKADTLQCKIADIILVTESGHWEKWSAFSGDTLLILLAHPLISFDHMIQIYPQPKSKLMLAHFHSYIPRHNIRNRFATYQAKSNQLPIEIK